MIHHTSKSFWEFYSKLPLNIQKTADRNFEILKSNPQHPSLPFIDWNYLNPTWDIDIWTDVHIDVLTKQDGTSILSITGDVSGDGFPSTEAFVKDSKGNSIFLGVGPAKAGKIKGPMWTLLGDENVRQFDIKIRIDVNKNGIFIGVITKDKNGNETTVTPSDWNKKFESKSAVGSN